MRPRLGHQLHVPAMQQVEAAIGEANTQPRAAPLREALIEHRKAYFTELGGFVDTPVYARARLAPGTKIEGPALIEEAESTSVIGPKANVEVDRFGNLIMRIEAVPRDAKATENLQEKEKR